MLRVRPTVLLVAGALGAVATSSHADVSRYPYDNFAQAGEYGGTYSGTAQDLFPLSCNLNLDPTFSGAQKALLRSAMTLFVERAARRETVDCAYRNGTKDLPASRQDFEAQLVAALVYRRLDALWYPGHAYVARFWGDDNTVGRGYVNLFYDHDKPLPGYKDRHYLHIALNSDYLGPGKSYWLAQNADYWAGVIAHEALHNLGYRHPTGYPGSFIEEYGRCVWHNGADAEGPEGVFPDEEIEKDR